MRLSKDDIFKAEDTRTEEVEVPEWNGSVLVRGMTGRQRDEFEASMLEMRGKQLIPNVANVRAKTVVRCIVDDEGNRVFTDSDADELGEKAGSAIDKVYDVAARLSGITDSDIEQMTQGFGKAGGTTSPTDSPATSGGPSKNSSKA